MRVARALVGAALCGAALIAASVAHADNAALNGRFLAISDGEWAQTNDVYRNEATVRSTWTIQMSCESVRRCSGTVISDAGWTADVVINNSEYIVERELPGWEPCADGRTVTGHQMYRFFPVGPDGYMLPGSRTFAGFDKTSGVSGGCSLNEKLEIEMPLRLERLD